MFWRERVWVGVKIDKMISFSTYFVYLCALYMYYGI